MSLPPFKPHWDNKTLIRYAYRRPLKTNAKGKLIKPSGVSPVGVVVAQLINDKVHFGWSKCSSADKFCKKTALTIATLRCQKNRYENIAVTLRPVLLKLAERAQKFFKQPVVLNPWEEKTSFVVMPTKLAVGRGKVTDLEKKKASNSYEER